MRTDRGPASDRPRRARGGVEYADVLLTAADSALLPLCRGNVAPHAGRARAEPVGRRCSRGREAVKQGWSHFTNNDLGRGQGFRWFRGEDAETKRRRDNALNVLSDAKAIRQDLVLTGRGAVQKWAVNPDLGEKIHHL
jgi:hypothetical protein